MQGKFSIFSTLFKSQEGIVLLLAVLAFAAFATLLPAFFSAGN